MNNKSRSESYAASGVDITAGYKAVELISVSFIKVFFPALYRLFPVIDRSGDLLFKPDQFLVTGVIRAFLYISLQMLAAFDVPEVQLLVVIDCDVVVHDRRV